MTEYGRRPLLTGLVGLVAGATPLARVSRRAGASSGGESSGDRERWTAEVAGRLESAPTVVDGTVYVQTSRDIVHAIDMRDGSTIWTRQLPALPGDAASGTVDDGADDANGGAADGVDDSLDGRAFSPTVVDGTVYAATRSGTLWALDARRGEVEWSCHVPAVGIATPATVWNGRAVFGTGNGYLVVVDAATGRWLDQVELDGTPHAPVVVDGTLYAGTPTSAFAIDPATGDVSWSTERACSAPLAVADGTVYAVSEAVARSRDEELVYATIAALDADSGAVEWEDAALPQTDSAPTVAGDAVYCGSSLRLVALDASDGTERWTNAGEGVPTVAGGTAYLGTAAGEVRAVDADSGDTRWTVALDGGFRSAPIVVDGTVVLCSTDGTVHAVEAETDGRSEDSRARTGAAGHHGRLANQTVPAPEPPHAVVDVRPDERRPDERVVLDAGRSVGELDRVEWTLGDGERATGRTLTYDFARDGPHTVELAVAGPDGEDAVSRPLLVPPGPVEAAVGVEPAGPAPGERVQLSADAADGAITEYSWQIAGEQAGDGREEGHSFESPGDYQVELAVAGPDGSDATERTVAVRRPGSGIEVERREDRVVDLRLDVEGYTVETYEWDLGDGATARGSRVEHRYEEPGEYDVAVAADGPNLDVVYSTTLDLTGSQGDELAGPGLVGGAAGLGGAAYLLSRRSESEADDGDQSLATGRDSSDYSDR